MTEDEARGWVGSRYSAAVLHRLDTYVALIAAENHNQNLVAPSTIPTIWSRHIVDSAQLLLHAPGYWQYWVDIGAGAGLPGVVIAILTEKRVTLIEPRRLRADFLKRCAEVLDVDVAILQAKAEGVSIEQPVDVVSARAVAKLDTLFAASAHFSTKNTTYILPKGEGAKSEVAVARRSWHGTFHVEQSIVDPKSGIVVARGIARR